MAVFGGFAAVSSQFHIVHTYGSHHTKGEPCNRIKLMVNDVISILHFYLMVYIMTNSFFSAQLIYYNLTKHD